MSSATEWVTDAMEAGGYPALGGLILLENLFPPIPSELILPLAGYSVSQGQLTLVLAILAATVGSVVGALLLYGIARRGGRPVIYGSGRVCGYRTATLIAPTHGLIGMARGSCSSVDSCRACGASSRFRPGSPRCRSCDSRF